MADWASGEDGKILISRLRLDLWGYVEQVDKISILVIGRQAFSQKENKIWGDHARRGCTAISLVSIPVGNGTSWRKPRTTTIHAPI